MSPLSRSSKRNPAATRPFRGILLAWLASPTYCTASPSECGKKPHSRTLLSS
ncbi:hypothetical protein PF005_g8492 [Phytophthora fragariae]|uniref:Uncharacterized protein n=1 Tax=Phytophthora fragariae TaxID=53985 RepID=A0A6A3SM23_9STRA|nr:hypothetical protein PF003_g18342 [Phytophthora fragariae]KAE8940905.1 hypothetical protein PF009_g9302 [Phytophthora fragariae]KAE9017183.1 hypothetical protein PF011_g6818 [Phytophthora fragariae]KAE9106119.1 hypothetical protein PF010_g12741 [Phytophthora fragariae]KAE9119576.1 hypothetical protein PF007_g8490 [Phytophthora fragariae]